VQPKRIAVIGAGVGGLTAALRLRQAGHEVVVYEGQARVGGLINTSSVDGFVREHAASSFLGGPGDGALGMCQELGVAVDKASSRAKRRWIFIDGKLQALPRNPIELARSALLTNRGKFELLRESMVPPRDVERDGDTSVYEFAVRRFGPEAARALIAPFVTGVYAADARDVSLQAGFKKFAEFDKGGGILRSVLTGAGKGAVQRLGRLLGLMHDDGSASVGSTPHGMWAPRGGLGALIAGLERSLPGVIRTQTTVRTVQRDNNATVVTLDDGTRETFDGVVLAVSAGAATALLPDDATDLKSRLACFERTPVALAYLGFAEAALTPESRDGFGFLVAMGERLRVLGVVFESVVWEGRAPAGQVLFRCIYGGGRDPSAFDFDDATLLAQARSDLATALDLRAEPTHQSVVRWRQGIPRVTMGHADRVAAAQAVARRHRIVLAGADYRGVSVNDLCADATVVTQEVAQW
jgi:oxygen-dependent protoporphyrinogen oxidase